MKQEKTSILFLYGFPTLKKDLSIMIQELRKDHFVTEEIETAKKLESFSVIAYSSGVIQFLDILRNELDIQKKIKKLILISPVGIKPTNTAWHSLRFLREVLKTQYRTKVIIDLFWELSVNKNNLKNIRRIAKFNLLLEVRNFSSIEVKIIGNNKDSFIKTKTNKHNISMENVGRGHFAPLEVPWTYNEMIRVL
ncbi:MAG: hypothetical protein ACQEP6_01060 [Patescibacteria group bacterium]